MAVYNTIHSIHSIIWQSSTACLQKLWGLFWLIDWISLGRWASQNVCQRFSNKMTAMIDISGPKISNFRRQYHKVALCCSFLSRLPCTPYFFLDWLHYCMFWDAVMGPRNTHINEDDVRSWYFALHYASISFHFSNSWMEPEDRGQRIWPRRFLCPWIPHCLPKCIGFYHIMSVGKLLWLISSSVCIHQL